MRNAVIVCGHAVYTALDFARPLADESWHHLPYQRGEAPAHVEHIRAGIQAAAADPDALLVLGGGQTRREAGPRSEGGTYWLLAEHFEWWGHSGVRQRTVTEEFSRDSIENLLFGICRFREYCGHLPELVTVVSWEFKRSRFDRHRAALNWPSAQFRFLGPNNPAGLERALAGEALIVAEFAQHPYGTEEMRQRREGRNPFRRQHGFHRSCPEMVEYLRLLD